MNDPSAAASSRHHVVHVIASLQTGGAERQLVNYLTAADHDDFRHSVLCLKERGDFADEVERQGVPVTVHPVRLRRFFQDLGRVADWLDAQSAAVVHTHMFPAAFWGRSAALRARVPLIMTTEHGKEPWKKWWHIAVDRWLGARTFRHIAVSKDVLEIRRRRDGVPLERIVQIPNGVPLPDLSGQEAVKERMRVELGVAPDRIVIGSVGRVVAAKAYPDLLQAVALARREIPGLHWLQVGNGPALADLELLTDRLGLRSAVTFAGHRRDVTDLLAAMDIWVMSSIREGLPVALLEAMAAARPIVATRAGGIPDAVTDERSGLLVAPGNPEDLAGAVVRLCRDPDLAAGLAMRARGRIAADFSIEAVARRIEDIYREGLAAAVPI